MWSYDINHSSLKYRIVEHPFWFFLVALPTFRARMTYTNHASKFQLSAPRIKLHITTVQPLTETHLLRTTYFLILPLFHGDVLFSADHRSFGFPSQYTRGENPERYEAYGV